MGEYWENVRMRYDRLIDGVYVCDMAGNTMFVVKREFYLKLKELFEGSIKPEHLGHSKYTMLKAPGTHGELIAESSVVEGRT